MAEIKCSGLKHIRVSEIVCIECNVTVCSKCIKYHTSHKILDQDDIFEEMVNREGEDTLNSLVDKMNKEKFKSDLIFQNDIKNPYELEKLKIGTFFKSLQGRLKNKEESLCKDNTFFYKYNNDKRNLFLEKINEEILVAEECLDIIGKINQDSDPVLIIQAFCISEFLLEKYSETKEITYHKYLITDHGQEKNFLEPLTIQPIIGNGYSKDYIYCYGDQGLEVLNCGRDDPVSSLKTLIDVTDQPPLNTTDKTNFINQNASFNGNTYIFQGNEFWVYKESELKWRKGETKLDKSINGLSSLFDGQKFIYLFAGHNTTTKKSSKTISRFNIETEEIEILGEDTFSDDFKICSLSLDYVEQIIYIIGKSTKLQGIYQYSILSNATTEYLSDSKCKELFGSYESGCYVPSKHSLFIVDSETSFYQYNTKSKTSVNVSQPGSISYDHKLMFDGSNIIYIVSNCVFMEKTIVKYTIDSDKWDDLSWRLKNDFSSEVYYSLSNH